MTWQTCILHQVCVSEYIYATQTLTKFIPMLYVRSSFCYHVHKWLYEQSSTPLWCQMSVSSWAPSCLLIPWYDDSGHESNPQVLLQVELHGGWSSQAITVAIALMSIISSCLNDTPPSLSVVKMEKKNPSSYTEVYQTVWSRLCPYSANPDSLFV